MQTYKSLTTGLAGRFYFSKRQRKELDKKGRHRTFCVVGGKVREYTELIDFETLAECPGDMCFYDDAEYLGEGVFSHFKDL